MNCRKLSTRLSGRKSSSLITEMNVVPYVDVMLVLLVIFMITTPLLSQGVQLELPQANAKVLKTKSQIPMVVSIDAAGHYYLNKSQQPNVPMNASQLLTRVAAELRLATMNYQPSPAVLVKGDKNVRYDTVLHAMSLLQQAGVTQVGLVVQPSPV